jgi:hypothetical protein
MVTIQPLKMTILSANDSTLVILGKLGRIDTHNPRRHLNRNWELLQGISTDLGNQPLKLKKAKYELHDRSLDKATRERLKFPGDTHEKNTQNPADITVGMCIPKKGLRDHQQQL